MKNRGSKSRRDGWWNLRFHCEIEIEGRPWSGRQRLSTRAQWRRPRRRCRSVAPQLLTVHSVVRDRMTGGRRPTARRLEATHLSELPARLPLSFEPPRKTFRSCVFTSLQSTPSRKLIHFSGCTLCLLRNSKGIETGRLRIPAGWRNGVAWLPVNRF